MIIFQKNKMRVFFLGLLFIVPSFIFGAEFNLTSNGNVGVGNDFFVTLSFNTKEVVNAVEGRLTFPIDLLEVKEIKSGNSIINFWVNEPKADSPGGISFSGITPGGFKGDKNTIFSVVFIAKKNGSGAVSLSSVKSLLNDGNGTEQKVTSNKLEFAVNAEFLENKDGVTEIKDKELPESFKPEIARNPFLLEGLWFLVFATQDKNSGIKSYEVKESRQRLFAFLDEFVPATSPYVLSDQDLHSHVFIKVLDNAGNERIEKISPRYPLVWYQNSSYWITIIIFILVLLGIKQWKRRHIKQE